MSDIFTSPLSPGQEQIWFLHQLAPDQCAYNLTFGIRLRGTLDVAALITAMTQLVRRHETLRTTVDDTGSQPRQIVAPSAPVALLVEIVDTESEEAERTAYALLRAEAATPFDPTVNTFRPRLIRLSTQDHLLSMCMHHLVSDAGSYHVLARDLGELYRAACTGTAPVLPEQSIQYADFAVWQRERHTSDDTAGAIAYWQERLRDAPDLNLRTDHPRPVVQSFRGETIVIHLPAELMSTVDKLARGHRVTPFMALVAALNVVLARYTGQDDVVIGSVESGRVVPDVAPVVGPFVTSVVLRTDLSGDPPFVEVLRRVRGVLLDAADHADVPFDRLVDANPQWRRPDRNPIFQVAVSQLPEYPDLAPETGVDGEILLVGPGGARFDLNINVHRHHGELRLYVEYCTDLFAEEMIRRLLRHFEHVLSVAAKDPDLPLSRIPLLSPEERATVLGEWQGERRPYPRTPVHQLVSAQAKRTPDMLAATGAGELTYAELDRRSDALARYLRRRGVGHESVVGVAMERCADVLVAYLAVAKAGGAYLPLDPGHPAKRLDYVVDDAGAALVLTRSADAGRLPAWPDRDLVVIDDAWPEITVAADDELPELTDDRSAVYVLYTSGSTGNPKGVIVEHGALANYASWLAEYLAIQPGDVMFQYFSLVFDVAHGEIFTNLIAGATNALVPPEITLSPPALADFIRAYRCVYVGAPPAMLSLIEPGPYPDLRNVLVVGEPFPGSLVNRWNQPGRRFINLYGPTEATVGCTSYVCERLEWQANPPIGRPIHNTRIYIVDRHGNPAPVGVPGELLIAGAGLARGYLGRPELTAEKFAEDPFRPGQRAYRTGDLAMWRADGQLVFLGRMDNQVKLRGQRVELGEIEAAIAGHPNVRQVAVVVHGPQGGDKRLVAYLVPAGDGDIEADISAQSVRDHVAGELPAYMVPASYVILDSLPLGPSGKLNRKALPEPSGLATERTFIQPRTAEELLVAAAYAEVLGVDKVGAEDDFFALGGTSLTVAAVVNQLKARTGVVLALRDLYAQPTVEAVAAALRAETKQADTRPRVVVLRDGGTAGAVKTPLFCLPHVFGDSLAYRRLLTGLPSDQPLYSVEPPAPGPVFAAGLDGLVDTYLAAVRAWRPGDPFVLTGHSMGGTTAFAMALRLAESGAPPAGVILAEPSIEFGLSTRRADLARRFVELRASVAELPVPQFPAGLDATSDEEFFATLSAVMTGARIDDTLDSTELRRMWDGYAAAITALRNYQPHGRYPGRLALIRSEVDSITTAEEWAPRCAELVEVVVPGNHFSMWNEPNVAEVTRAIANSLK